MSNAPYNAPSVVLPNEIGKIIDLKKFRPNPVVLFFYPRDNTSGCTREAKDFTEHLGLFEGIKASVFGVSKDSIKSHEKFIKKQDLAISLLSDQNGTVCEDFGVWKEKSMYGKTYMGIERSTFIISGKGLVVKEWRKVKVAGHINEVLQEIEKIWQSVIYFKIKAYNYTTLKFKILPVSNKIIANLFWYR